MPSARPRIHGASREQIEANEPTAQTSEWDQRMSRDVVNPRAIWMAEHPVLAAIVLGVAWGVLTGQVISI